MTRISGNNDLRFTIYVSVFMAVMALGLYGCSSCSSCNGDGEPETTITSSPVKIHSQYKEPEHVEEEEENVIRIEIGPSKRSVDEAGGKPGLPKKEVEALKSAIAALPPDTYEESDLTARLRDKMLDAYAGQEEAIPDVKIYVSDMKYDEFVSYYQSLGYNVQTVAVPARQVIEPVLEQRPELAGKIKLSDYDSVVIHQVMVNDAGISAADKYIDPDTFEVIDRTFVTKMNK